MEGVPPGVGPDVALGPTLAVTLRPRVTAGPPPPHRSPSQSSLTASTDSPPVHHSYAPFIHHSSTSHPPVVDQWFTGHYGTIPL